MRLMRFSIVAILIACGAIAQPLEWPVSEGGNGHFYELVFSGDVDTWRQAHDLCISSFHQELQGHLVTITNQAENDFVLNSVITPSAPNSTVFFMGAWNDGYLTGEPVLELWHWITGEEWDFTAWAPTPIIDPYEQVLSFLYNWNWDFTGWNNLFFYYPNVSGYIVEYDEVSVIDMPPSDPVRSVNQSWGSVKALFR